MIPSRATAQKQANKQDMKYKHCPRQARAKLQVTTVYLFLNHYLRQKKFKNHDNLKDSSRSVTEVRKKSTSRKLEKLVWTVDRTIVGIAMQANNTEKRC